MNHNGLLGSMTAIRPPENLTPELADRINVLQQRFAGMTARRIFAVGKTSKGKPIELELFAIASPLDTPLIQTAKTELQEINRLLSAPPKPPKPPRFPSPRKDWREVIANEPGLRGLIESSPVKNLLTGSGHCEAFADALFSPDDLIKVKGKTVLVSTREHLRGAMQKFNFISPLIYSDRSETTIKDRYEVLTSGGNLDVQAKRLSWMGKTFPLAAVCFDGRAELEGWFRVESDNEREKLLIQFATFGGEPRTLPFARMPDATRDDLMPSHAHQILASAGMDELLDPRGTVRQGYDSKQMLVYLA
jgi:hypothetical protein